MAVVIASSLDRDMAGSPLFRGVSFKLERGDRMTLAGRNGADAYLGWAGDPIRAYAVGVLAGASGARAPSGRPPKIFSFRLARAGEAGTGQPKKGFVEGKPSTPPNRVSPTYNTVARKVKEDPWE